MARKFLIVCVLTVPSLTGCGDSKKNADTSPLSPEVQEKVRQEDTARDAEEGGFGNTKGSKKSPKRT